MWTQRTIVGICSIMALAGHALGDDTVRVSNEDGRVVISDVASGRVLYDQRRLRLYSHRNDERFIVPEVEVVARPTGMDLVYTYRNDGSETRPLSDMRVGTLVMPDELIMQDTKMLGGQDVAISPEDRPSIAYTYPDNTYAPVYVVRDDEQAVGVSLLYPMFEYKHDVQFRFRQAPPSDDGYRGWMMDIRISRLPDDNAGRGWIDFGATLEPGESRSYTVTVRYDREPDEWVRTLLPYRDYFREIYGGVHYQRRTNPVVAYSTGEGAHISRDNPFGYRSDRIRPDVHGFGPMVDQMMEPQGWSEMLVFKPTGQYYYNREWNYPFLMLSNLESSEEFRTAFDRDIGLASIPARGRDLTVWWGRTLQVANEWDPVDCHAFDPRNPDDRAAAYSELDCASRLGVTAIGLDTYTHDLLPVWDSYAWLRDMTELYPQMHFFIEPLACDVLHSLAPTWMRGWDESGNAQRPDDIYRITGPNMLADFLLPGHETVLPMRYQEFQDKFGIDPTEDRVNNDVARFASWGFRPIIFTTFDLVTPAQADQSWLWSIPADLQIPQHEWMSDADPYDGTGGFAKDDDHGGGDDDSGPGFGGADAGGVVRGRVLPPPGGGDSFSDRFSGGGGGGGQSRAGLPDVKYDPSTDRISTAGAGSRRSAGGAIVVHRRGDKPVASVRFNPETDRISKPGAAASAGSGKAAKKAVKKPK